MYSIGTASAQSGVSIETIRYYERRGIVGKPGRSAAGRRLYTDAEIARLRFVRRCRDMDFPMETIRNLLELATGDDGACRRASTLINDRIHDIRQRIASLGQLLSMLEEMSRSCDPEHDACPMLAALMQDGGIDQGRATGRTGQTQI